MSKKANPDIKQLRAIGHKLKPVVTVAGKGLTETVGAELERALTDHELIKVKLAVGSRETRAEISRQICEQSGAELVQSIGNIIVLLRRSATPDPRLSNLIKPL
jgi:RNA-binding protein